MGSWTMRFLLFSLFMVIELSVSRAETPQASSAHEIAIKLYPEFDVDETRGCALDYQDMRQKLDSASPENLRADVLFEMAERALSTHDKVALTNVIEYFGANRFDVIPWNERLEKLFLGVIKNPDEELRLTLTDALPGFPQAVVPRFEELLLHDPSAKVRKRVPHTQKEIDYEESLKKK